MWKKSLQEIIVGPPWVTCLLLTISFGWDTKAGTGECRVASSGQGEALFPLAKQNHLLFLCVLKGSFASLFLCM